MSLLTRLHKIDFLRLTRSVWRYLFLLVCTFLFCFQQTAGLVYRSELSRGFPLRSEIQSKSTASHTGILLSVQLPLLPAVEQLEPSEDDDPQHAQQTFSHESSRQLLSLEWAFAQAIRTFYRQQSLAVKQMNRPPLFLLHHQWRSIPS